MKVSHALVLAGLVAEIVAGFLLALDAIGLESDLRPQNWIVFG